MDRGGYRRPTQVGARRRAHAYRRSGGTRYRVRTACAQMTRIEAPVGLRAFARPTAVDSARIQPALLRRGSPEPGNPPHFFQPLYA